MGCSASIPKRYASIRKRKHSRISEVAVFAPALRIPVAFDLVIPLSGVVPRDVVDRLSEHRGRIISLAEGNGVGTMPTVSELERELQEYLPLLLGLTRQEHRLESSVEFKWKSLGDDGQETCLASAWYEVLSVVHMMAMLLLLQANQLLIPKPSTDKDESKGSEGSEKDAVDLLLKASGCLDLCVHHILANLPLPIRPFESLPDLPEFPLSLEPDEYNLPNIDASWDSEICPPQFQTLKEHLIDEEDETGTM